MNLLDSLLDAIIRLDGDALVMHVGEKPYVVTTTEGQSAHRGPLSWGQVELSSRVLTPDAVIGMLGQLLPLDQRQALDELGAIDYQIAGPVGSTEQFTVIAARGGDDVWLEVRRRRPRPVVAEAAEEIAPTEAVVAEGASVAPLASSEVAEPAETGHAASPVENPVAAVEQIATESDDEVIVFGEDHDADTDAFEPAVVAADAECGDEEDEAAEPYEILLNSELGEHEVSVDAMGEEASAPAAHQPFEIVQEVRQHAPTDEDVDALLAATAQALLNSPQRGGPPPAADVEQESPSVASEETEITLALEPEVQAVEPAAVASEPEPELVVVAPEPEPVAVAPEPEPVAVAPEPEPEPEPVAVAPEPEPEPVAVVPEPEPVAVVPEPEPEPVAVAPEPELEPVAVAPEPEPVAVAPEPEPVAVVPEPEPEPEPVAVAPEPEPEPVAVAPEPEPDPVAVAPEPEPEPVAVAPEPEPEPEPVAVAPEPEPEPVAVVPEPEPEPVAVAPEPEPVAVAPEPEPVAVAPEPEPEPVALAPEPEPVAVAWEPEPVAVAPEPEPEPVAVAPEPRPVIVPLTRRGRTDQAPPMTLPVLGIEELLRTAAARGASTMYVVARSEPMVRAEGEINVLHIGGPLSEADIERMLLEVATPSARDAWQRGMPAEWLCDVAGVGRVRALTFTDHRGHGLIFRMIPPLAISADQLGLTPEVQAFCGESEGLVLVAGPRASGKSTLLTAFVDLINRTRSDHVITLEPQIGFVHENRRSFVSQREVGPEAAAGAARNALREDPDVLFVEEVRSAEVAALALEAADSGRLVFASVQAPSTVAAIERLVELFPADRRAQVQSVLAGVLRGVVSQVLLRRARGGRLAAREVLLNTATVSGIIEQGQTAQLARVIESGRRSGMMPLNDALAAVVRDGTVHVTEAYRKAFDKDALLAALKRDGVDTSVVERLA